MTRYSLLCLIMVLCCGGNLLLAQDALVLRAGDSDLSIGSHVYLYTGHASHTAIDTLIHSDSTQFVRHRDSPEINYGVHQPRGWCTFSIRNESNERDWILKIQQSMVDTVQLYLVRGHQIEMLPMTGHYQQYQERPVHSLPFAYNIRLEKGEVIRCYLYSARQYGRHMAILTLQTKAYFDSYQYGFSLVFGFVCGMVALVALMGLFLFLFVQQKLYIYYSIYALSFLFVLLADTGLMHAALFFPLDQTVANGFTMICYYLMGGCLGFFTIELLQLQHEAKPWVYWFGRVLSFFLSGVGILLLFPGLPVFLRSAFISNSYYLALVINFYILYVISISLKKKEPIVYFYMLGFFLTSLVAVFITLTDFQVIQLPRQNKDIYYLTPFLEILCVALGIGIHFAKTLKERVNAQLALNQTQHQIITIQEDERRRIAQDLHDDVGNSLAAVRNMIVHQQTPAVVEKEIDTIIKTLRSISHDLMPVDFHEFSLADITANSVDKFKDHPHLVLDFNQTGEVVRLHPHTELVVYRIISELITNVVKHSKARNAFVQLIYQKTSLVVTVEDNGIGIRNAKTAEGIGMRSIRLRAAYIHAQLKIESDDKGTQIILEVPYEGSR
ncbi:MAG: hypothetical protein HYZ44_17125 [Bacteroidetes bacterium]|nr:hypothetical protein [Bacteroidota bacterium]